MLCEIALLPPSQPVFTTLPCGCHCPRSPAEARSCPCARIDAPHAVCPEHGLPVHFLCDGDKALLCPSCAGLPAHAGHRTSPLDQSTDALQDLAGTLMQEMLSSYKAIGTACVDWKGQVAVAQFLSECQCALITSHAEKVKAFADSAAPVACAMMRGQVEALRVRRGEALGRLSRSSVRAAVLAAKAARVHEGCSAAGLVGLVSELRAVQGLMLPDVPPLALRLMLVDRPLHDGGTSPPVVCLSSKPRGPLASCVTLQQDFGIAIQDGRRGRLVVWGINAPLNTPDGDNFISVTSSSDMAIALRCRIFL